MPAIFNIALYGTTLVLVLHALLAMWIMFSRIARSYAECIYLFHKHGRTYFAAATLMDFWSFLATSAVYGVTRVADDLVDSEEPAELRKKRLDKFMEDFWRCFEKGEGDYDLHPVLPAAIQAALYSSYPRENFETFFRSMSADSAKQLTINTYDELLHYCEGSAAVIGDFMIPVLMRKNTEEERNKALPHARDLGNAFQLTNMIRDINDDLTLGRQYMPVEICEKHGVSLELRDHKQPGWKPFMEEMLGYTEKFYESADIGVEFLPIETRELIKVARVVYSKIHDAIREADYDIFHGRLRVPFQKKMNIALGIVSTRLAAWIIFVELYVNFLKFFYYTGPVLVPLSVILCLFV